MQTGISAAQGTLKLASLLPCLGQGQPLRCGMQSRAAPRGLGRRASYKQGGHPAHTTGADHWLHWERARNTSVVLERQGENALHQLWSQSFAEQTSGGPSACSEFSVLPQLCWEREYFAVVPAPNRLQHTTAVLVYFDQRDTNWCQHKVTHSQSIHWNAYLGSLEIITVILRYKFKDLQLMNMHRLIYNPDSVLGTGKVSGVIKLKTQWQGHITSPDGTVC